MKVCIDPGHGGSDPGAIGRLGGRSYYEKDINLTDSFFLAAVLYSFGVDFLMTRWGDIPLTLQERTDLANGNGCDLFVSIHCNSFTSPEPRGFEAWHHPNSEKGSDIAVIVADKVSSIPWLYAHGDGVGGNNFFVLRKTRMSAILLELSFLSNEEDLRNLVTLPNSFMLMRLVGEAIASDEVRGILEV